MERLLGLLDNCCSVSGQSQVVCQVHAQEPDTTVPTHSSAICGQQGVLFCMSLVNVQEEIVVVALRY